VDQDWGAIVGLAPDDVPHLLVTEGSWWRREREAQRLAVLTDVRELGAPDWWWGRWRGRPVVYACVYGAARTVEPVHVLGQLGCPAVAQIGSCGGLAPGIRPGDLVVADRITAEDGASGHYGAGDAVLPDPGLVRAVVRRAEQRGLAVHTGPTVTTEVLLRQPDPLVTRWRREGALGVDMESAATVAAAVWTGARGVSALYAWDDLTVGRSWTDPLPEADDARRRAAEAALFELVLEATLPADIAPVEGIATPLG